MRRLGIIAAILFILVALTFTRVTGSGAQRVPVLLYHHLVRDAANAGGSSMHVVEFAKQIARLHAEGYQTITTAELGDWLEGRTTIPAKAVLITFDDGYESVYEMAWPILKAYGFKATVFIISSQIGKTPGQFPHLSGKQMNEMRARGLIEFQDHSFNAHYLTEGGAALAVWSEQEIGQDLAASQTAFAAESMPRPRAFAYPFGAWHERTLRQLKEAGYRLGFTGVAGFVQRGDNPLLLKRIVAYPGMKLG